MIKLKANAKINLSLKIIGQRPDGYHNIQSEMQSISLYDEIILSEAPSGINVICDEPQIPIGPQNIAYKAAQQLLKEIKSIRGLTIEISKNIPSGAGLGGGSADAAAVLWGINEMQGRPVSEENLLAVAGEIGADVPFCLIGGRAEATGKGENLKKLNPLPEFCVVVVKPDFEVSTAWAYAQWDNLKNKPSPQSDNDFEAVVGTKYPQIMEIKNKLLTLGCYKAQMSGSGSAVFGLIRDRSAGMQVVRQIKDLYPRVLICHSINKGIFLTK